jgi:hypothetical protein
VPGGDEQVDPLHQPIVIHPVVVNEGATRCLCDTHALARVDPGVCADPWGEDVGLVQQLRELLDTVQGVDQPRLVVVERACGDSAQADPERG